MKSIAVAKIQTPRQRPAWNRRVSDEEIVAAYMETGSIWKAGKRIGLSGQSVHERLRRLGIEMVHQEWTRAELDEACHLAAQGEPLAQVAARLGRTYYAVAIKLSRRGVRSRHTGWRWKPRRSSFLAKTSVAQLAKELAGGGWSVRRLARREGLAVTPLVDALQVHEPRAWRAYVERHSGLEAEVCLGCANRFVPLTKRQAFCTVRCREGHRRNMSYFGGRRLEAVGLREGVCQLCRKKVSKWLSVHHLLGKENDPTNEALIALCRGCHDIVTRIASRPWVEDATIVSDLIGLALARRGRTRAVVSIEIEDWTIAELQEQAEALASYAPNDP